MTPWTQREYAPKISQLYLQLLFWLGHENVDMFELDPPIIVSMLESLNFRRQHNNGNERDSWFFIN